MVLVQVRTPEQYKKYVKDATGLVVVIFYSTWSGPCKTMIKTLNNMAQDFKKISFVVVDVDELVDQTNQEKILVTPTFQFVRGGVKIADLVGADQTRLKDLVIAHA
eukprot:TRINITY_DN1640_c0_g1_i1.p2 TRINITY_DN1640_c0_g1~~TRINITY_DN1640_c0_g1_i1.p2  ORF type:complete len:106 (-),score=10.73 TRINITY_DN1640_c0_g1_i1:31-348(-)